MIVRGAVSVRLRLTLWYSAVLAVGLFLFALAAWFSLRQSLLGALKADLSERGGRLQSFLRTESAEPGVHLREELEEYSLGLPDGTYFAVKDGNGNQLFASNPAFVWTEHPAGTTGSSYWFSHDGQRYWIQDTSMMAGKSRLAITGATSTREAEKLLRRFRLLLLTLMPVVLVIASAGGFWLSRIAMKPVDDITQAARLLSIRDLSRRLEVPKTGDELQRLSETWNSMLDRLEDAVQRLTRFTQDASHELRTPLAIIRSTAEIASRRSRPEEAYRSAFRQVVDESERLTTLVEDLLLLARGDSVLPPALADLDVSELLMTVCRDMEVLADAKSVSMRQEIPGVRCIRGNEQSLRRLLTVLIDNAINYSCEGGEVTVRLTQDIAATRVLVIDNGVGIGSEDLPKIFDRFYRGTAARQVWDHGAGLGLALASSIAQQHGASIQVKSEPGCGSTFTINFPGPPAI